MKIFFGALLASLMGRRGVFVKKEGVNRKNKGFWRIKFSS
jgi:hypothetical protein